MGKKKKAKRLKDVCLHCGFMKMHRDKWPDWRPDRDNKDPTAFNDMVRSAANIVSEVFGMLGEKDRAAFYARVDRDIAKRETFAAIMSGKPISVKEMMEKLGIIKPDEPVKH